MESYTYLFLFVLQLVFTVVVLLALLHEKRLQKQLEKKNKQLQEKEKTTNGCSLWTFLKFMFFFLSFCLVHDNWASIKNFIRRLWKK